MDIRYGFDIAVDFAQPTTFLTMMDVHSDFRGGITEETALGLEPVFLRNDLSMTAETWCGDCRRRPARLRCDFRASFAPTGARTRLIRRRKLRRCLICRPTRCHSSDPADIARRSSCQISPGRISGR